MSEKIEQDKEPTIAELMAQQKVIERNMAKRAEEASDKPKSTPRKRVKKNDTDR